MPTASVAAVRASSFAVIGMQFKTEPYEHQLHVWDESKDREYYALFMEQGTGKTKVTIDTASYLYSQSKIKGMLVLAPNGVHSNWIINELPAHCGCGYHTHTWNGKNTKRENKKINDFMNDENPGLKVLAMNIEAIRTARGLALAAGFLKQFKTLLVIDESTIIKNYRSLQGKTAINIGKLAQYRRILSGTPVAQSPLDLWGQAQFLSSSALPQSNYTAFKNQYAVTILDNNGQHIYEKVVGYQNLEKLTESIKPFSFRIMKKECLDLPEKVYQNEIIPLTKEQDKHYNEMKELAFSMVDQGLITSTNAVTTILRLHQIVCGFVKDDDGVIHDIKNNRLTRLVEMCESIDDKIIIWAVFKHNIRQIKEALGDQAVTYYGETSKDDRSKAVYRFNNDDSVKYFIGNEAASRGLTLVRSSTSIYFTNNFKLETRLQSEDRNHRIGQERTTSYIDFLTPGTVDERIVKALQAKQNISETVLRDIAKLKDIL